MRILVSGSHGMVGSTLIDSYRQKGENVGRLLRQASLPSSTSGEDMVWNSISGQIDKNRMEGLDAVVHLAGESIASGRWNKTKKDRIRNSRVGPTRFLSETLSHLHRPPRVLVCASAIGFYGNRGTEMLTEESASGFGFLSEVCREWEEATRVAQNNGIRVVHLRFGIILSSKGGALAQMLTPFKLGVGGKLGNGSQIMSWVDLEDVISVIHFVIEKPDLKGAVNVVSPNPVSNLEFTKTLGRVLNRPTIFPVPKAAARLAFGEMADALLLSSARVVPQKLLTHGFQFQFPLLDNSLQHLLK